MKKNFLVAAILALIAVMAFSSAALAAEPIELWAEGDSAAEWTDEEAKVGDYSVKLSMRGSWWKPDNNAEIRISISDSPKISEITGWSYWTIAPDKYTTPIEFYVDTNDGGEYDKIIAGTKTGATPEGWFQVDKDYPSCYMTWKNGYEWLFNWDKVAEKYGDATLSRVDIGYGSLGSNEAVTAYIDDFTLNGTVYSFEPPPPPPPPPPPAPGPAPGAGGADNGEPSPPERLRIELPNAIAYFDYCGNATGEDIVFGDGVWQIQIPKGTYLEDSDDWRVGKLVVNENGFIVTDVTFTYHLNGTKVTVTRM